MRNWIDIVNDNLLTEAINYNDMFKVIMDKLSEIAKVDNNLEKFLKSINLNNDIKWAKQNLKKNDRIIWYLRLYRIYLLVCFGIATKNDESEKLVKSNILPILSKYRSELKSKNPNFDENLTTISFTKNIYKLQNSLTHYLSFDYPSVQNYVFSNQSPDEVFSDLEELVKEHSKRFGKLIPYDQNDKVVIDFSDEFKWVLLDREECEAEGNAMGHCGNSGDPKNGDRILSLRKIVLEGGKKFWRPSLTFILHKDGYLGEMKGRANEKPNKKYHPYIIKLLESNIIKGIIGGGYLPENNFSMSDLTEEDRNKLYEINPQLAPLSYLYEKYGMNEISIYKMKSLMKKWNSSYDGLEFVDSEQLIILDEYEDVTDFLYNINTKNVKKLKIMLKQYYNTDLVELDFDVENMIDKNTIISILDSCDSKKISYMKQNLKHLSRKKVNDWLNEENLKLEDLNSEQLFKLLEYCNDNFIIDDLFYSIEKGYQVAATKEFTSQLNDFLNKKNVIHSDLNEFIDFRLYNPKGNKVIQQEMSCLAIDYDTFMKHANDIEYIINNYHYDSFRRGIIIDDFDFEFNWSFDEDAALVDFEQSQWLNKNIFL